MHAGVRIVDHQVPAAVLAKTFEQRRAPATQFRGGMPQVAIEGAALHQLGQRCLLDAAATQVVVHLGGDEIVAQATRTDDIAQAQPREQHLREAADVDHPVTHVQRSQRRDGDAVVAELAVVVVLDHPAAALGGVVEQGHAPRQRHHGTGGKLVRRRDLDHADAVPTRQRLDPQTLGVHLDRQQARAVRLQCARREFVAGILDRTTSAPSSISTRASSETACCVPLTTTTSSASHTTPRRRARYSLMA